MSHSELKLHFDMREEETHFVYPILMLLLGIEGVTLSNATVFSGGTLRKITKSWKNGVLELKLFIYRQISEF